MKSNIINFPVQPSAVDTAKALTGLEKHIQQRQEYYNKLGVKVNLVKRNDIDSLNAFLEVFGLKLEPFQIKIIELLTKK